MSSYGNPRVSPGYAGFPLNPDQKMADSIHRNDACEPASIIEANVKRSCWDRLYFRYIPELTPVNFGGKFKLR